MASKNVELVRAIYAAWERGDFSSIDWAHPEIEFVLPDGPDPGRWNGVAEMGKGWRSRLRAWEGFGAVPDDYLELDDERVLVIAHGEGRGKTSGVDVAQKGATLFHVRDGKVMRLVAYFDYENALADLGLEV
jgi:ketosteroid isomerase-like protein